MNFIHFVPSFGDFLLLSQLFVSDKLQLLSFFRPRNTYYKVDSQIHHHWKDNQQCCRKYNNYKYICHHVEKTQLFLPTSIFSIVIILIDCSNLCLWYYYY